MSGRDRSKERRRTRPGKLKEADSCSDPVMETGEAWRRIIVVKIMIIIIFIIVFVVDCVVIVIFIFLEIIILFFVVITLIFLTTINIYMMI